MRLCSRCLPPLAPLSSLSLGVRHCHSLSSSGTASLTNASLSSAAVTERPPVSVPCTHGPTERLLATAPFSSHDVRDGTPKSVTEVRLAPAAAALLEQRARESVLRQDMCAADLHYFMHAEQYAAQQQQQEGCRRPAHGVADGSLARTEQGQLLPITKRGDSDTSSTLSRSEAALRARQLADLMVGRAPPSRLSSSPSEPFSKTHSCGVNESRTSVRFRQQQRLFALRRRLAYMLADDDSDVRAEDREEGPPLRALGRRAALALSLAQDIVDTSEVDGRENTEERQVERGKGKHCSNAGGRLSQPASVAAWEDASSIEAARRSGSVDQISSVRCAFVYRSLAQPVELTGRELDALLRWCARLVLDYATALAGKIRRDAEPAQPHNESPMSNNNDGECEAAPTPPPAARTSAVRPPSTLRMAAAHRTAAAIIDATAAEADEQQHDGRAPVTVSSPAPEFCDATVSATASLMELATAFVSVVTTLLRSRSDGVGAGGGDGAVGREPVSRLSSHVDAASDLDVETSRRGQLVADVVKAVCDTLDVLCCPAGRALLAGSVQVRRHPEEGTSATPTNSERVSRDASAPSSSVEAPAKQLLRSMSFSDHFVHSALCSMRESWAAALLLTQRMHESNVQLREVLLAPSGRAEVRDDGRESSPGRPPRALPRSTLHTLLYILAQHGRLAEVLDLCQRHLGFSVHDLFSSVATAVPATAESATRASRVAPALRLMGHIAAANADPATAARHLLADASPSSPASFADAAAATSLPHTTLYTQADCLEHVVQAGVMPQRVLGVTEYAMLLRRMLGARLVHGCGSSSSSGYHSAGGDTMKSQSAGAGCGVGWWLSPSQVWRFSAGYPHHIRTTLCLMGFQVTSQRGLTAALSMEDLYVVVSVSRQRMAARVQLPSTTPARKAEADVAAAAALHWREQRLATWGVEERPAPVLSNMLLLRGAREKMPQQAGAAAAAGHSLLPLLARRAAPPRNARCMQSLCAAFTAAHCPPHGAGSAVLLSLVSREMLQLLRAVHYTRDTGSYWEAALHCVATSVQASGGYGGTLSGGASPHEQADSELHTAEAVVEEIAYALAHAAESALSDSLDATRRLVAPIPSLAPYLSAYTVGALVQRPFRRALTWEQCLALLPYAPLGSRSQLWLLRRVAQDGEGRRRAFADVSSTSQPHSLAAKSSLSLRTKRPTVSPVVATLSRTAERMMAVQHHARRQQSRSVPPDTTATAQSPVHEAASASAGVVGADADASLLKLLLESHWRRALRVFEQSSARVRVGGAPHVVRLLVEADVWRDLDDVQRRPLVRLAVRSSASTGAGGPTALLEEVLQTSLEHGLWHTGLYFHQSVAAEQPELVQQCRRAQLYAAQLCRGLLGRTSMTLTVAQLTKAARCGRWADAAACFLRYATHSEAPVEGREKEEVDVPAKHSERGHVFSSSPFPPKRASGPAVSATSAAELCALAALMNARRPVSDGNDDLAAAAAPPTAEPPTFSFFAEGGGAVPAELAHVAQTVRYAMLRTPELWMHALRWLPTSALPLPYSHEVALRVLCAGNPAMQHALLPASASVHAQKSREEEEAGQRGQADAMVAHTTTTSAAAAVSAATATALSVVAAARRAHRPQRPNEAGKERQVTVANALQVLRHTGAWEEAILLYEKAVEANCMPYTSSNAVLESALQGGAPWEVTLYYFFHMAQRFRPDVAATAVALQACVEGDQWALAFRVLQQSVLTQSAPVPRLVELAVSAALHCGVWARALAAAQQYRRTRDPRLAHTVLLTFVRTRRWDDAVEYFYECTLRGLRPLDASLELAILASESASVEYRRTALMVGTIASALEDLYKLSGAVLEHILFVQRHSTSRASAGPLSMGVGWEGPLSFGSGEVTWGEQWESVNVSVEGDREVRPAGHADPDQPVLAMNLPDARASAKSPRQG